MTSAAKVMTTSHCVIGVIMQIECLVANVKAVGSPDRAERAIFGVFLAGRCFGQFRPYLWSGRHGVVYVEIPSCTPKNFTQGHLMIIEWLVTDVTADGSPDRAEHAILWLIFAWHFLANSGRICGRGATLRCRNPALSPKKFT